MVAPATTSDGSSSNGTSTSTTDYNDDHGDVEPGDAVLFPWFALAIGTFAYLVLSRYATWFPYTAVMFAVGTVTGVASVRLHADNVLIESITAYWVDIDSELLLLVFLPGLITKDALFLDFHLFQVAFWQCFNFAFPSEFASSPIEARPPLDCRFLA